MVKHTSLAYFFLFVGGVFGLHHVYLGHHPLRSVIWTMTFSLFGFGWMYDLFYIPYYVREANEDELYCEEMKVKQKFYPQPRISIWKLLLIYQGGMIFGLIACCIVPPENDIISYHIVGAIGSTIGVYCWGQALSSPAQNVSLQTMLFGSLVSQLLWYLNIIYEFLPDLLSDDVNEYDFNSATIAACGVYYISRYWCVDYLANTKEIEETKSQTKENISIHKIPNSRPKRKNFMIYIVLCILFTGSICVGISQYGKYDSVNPVTGEKETFTIYESLNNILQSPAFTEFKTTFKEAYEEAWNNPSAAWEAFKSQLDPDGTLRSYRELGLTEDATSSEIKRAYRKLVVQWHPDKHSGEDREEAKIKFMKIQEAYEILTKKVIKNTKTTQSTSTKKTNSHPDFDFDLKTESYTFEEFDYEEFQRYSRHSQEL